MDNKVQQSDGTFPGETKQKREAKFPWFVANIESSDGDVKTMVVKEILVDGFTLQADADKWIKENIEDGQTLISLRKGKAFKAQVVRKTEEL